MTVVQPEPTPNPAAIKFTLDRPAVEGRSQSFRAGSDPTTSPLGARIHSLGGIANVFLTANFVSVTKEPDADWQVLIPAVSAAIVDHFDGDGA
ncbi:MAG TPA: NifU N-terminal domain-containing protein [Miltoncostaeaceae bacterium]|nr:NifU N-terminal domain-containing protein [Miltoncostaeaceae bacterium]